MVKVMRKRSDEDIEPLLLRESLSEILGTIIALIHELQHWKRMRKIMIGRSIIILRDELN